MTDQLAEDWVALWQSELAAMAADRELRESWTGMLALMAGAATAVMHFRPAQADDSRGPNRDAGAAQPPGTSPIIAASELGGDAARRLNERIAELESRLAAFEQRTGGNGPAGSGDP